MADLSTKFMGLDLKNPIIAGSCSLTNDLNKIISIEEAGAGAVILRSLFEEELTQKSSNISNTFHPEAYDYNFNDASMLYGSKEYLDLIENSKSKLSIPVIASINCLGEKWWVNYSKDVQSAGADGIEINLAYLSFDINDDVNKIEQKYIDVIKAVKDTIDIPITIKIGFYFTSIPAMCKKIQDAGADSISIFNRYHKIGIDTEKLDFKSVHHYSSRVEMYYVLRWVAVLTSQLDVDFSTTSGVHNSDMLIQMFLAGAKTVQLASKLYRNGIGAITEMIDDLNSYMDKKNIKDMNELRNLLSDKKKDFKAFERIQYLKVAGGNF
jgi:dihydroorotate dehydrogenase (fumarate)